MTMMDAVKLFAASNKENDDGWFRGDSAGDELSRGRILYSPGRYAVVCLLLLLQGRSQSRDTRLRPTATRSCIRIA